MEVVKDDIFKAAENILIHQTNCQGVMGAGIAKQVKKQYPEVFKAYYHFCKTSRVEDILGTALICEVGTDKYIANVFGQVNYGKGIQTDYKALNNALLEVYAFAKEKGLSVAIPHKIGCGLGGGDWKIVSKMIEDVFTDVPAKLYQIRRSNAKS